MSILKEQAYKLIDQIPEDKMNKVLIILKEINEIVNDETDKFDMEPARETEKDLKGGNLISMNVLWALQGVVWGVLIMDFITILFKKL